MKQRENETDAFAETQMLPAIPAPTAGETADPFDPSEADPLAATESIDDILDAQDRAKAKAKRAAESAEAAEATQTALPTNGTRSAQPTHVAPFAPFAPLTRTPQPPQPAQPTGADHPAPPAQATQSAPPMPPAPTPTPAPTPPSAPAPAPVEQPATKPKPAEKPAKPDDGGFSGPPTWQESVPFDETGVLLRPESLRHHAMVAETELISAIKVDPVVDDGSEAAHAQRPGFWTGAKPRRLLLAFIVLVQAMLTLRNNNTAFEDEALYLYSGHLELGHLLYGTSTGTDFWSYFSGAPTLYPVLGSIADQIGGLMAARLLSLAFMLGVTCLLYLLTRRLFGTRAALCAAGLYCCTEATVFVGGLATYDAPALFLLALSAWLVVRYAEYTVPIYLLAAFPAALAVGTKYAALMFVPIIIVLSLLASLPRFGRWAWIRPVALTMAVTFVLYAMLKIAGSDALTGVQSTTTSRAQGTDSASTVLTDAAEWGGVVFCIALLGAVFLIRLPTSHRSAALPSARWQRVCLAVLLAGTALLAPAYQMHLHTAVSLQKHVAFGLFFAAPLAGYGLVRLVGPHFQRAQLGIGIGVLTFALGMGQSLNMFHVWPNSNALITEIVKYQQPNAHYLVGADEVAIYSLRGDTDAEPAQFSNTFFFGYVTPKGQYITGNAAYLDAIAAGYFRIIAYTGNDSPAVEQLIAQALYRNAEYELVAKIPEAESSGLTYYYIWVHR